MKILIATTVDKNGMGGIPTYVRNLESGLLQAGIDAVAADCHYTENAHYEITAIDYLKHIADIYSSGDRRGLISLLSTNHFCRMLQSKLEEFDLIHAQDPFIGLLLNKTLGRKSLVITVHGLNYEHSLESFSAQRGFKRMVKYLSGYLFLITRKIKYYEYLGLLCADRLICVDNNYASKIIRGGISPSKITVIHNTVDVEMLKRLSGDEAIYKPVRPYFLMLRRFAPKNGVEFGLMGFLDWADRKNVELLLAGDGQLKQRLQSICHAHRNGNKVIFLGEVSHEKTPALIKNAVATLVPSVPAGGVVEATSLAALESLSLGVPTIASNIGGLAEIDQGKGVMRLVPHGSAAEISVAIEDVYQAHVSGRPDRERLMNHVLDNFDTAKWIRKIIAVYEAALQAKEADKAS